MTRVFVRRGNLDIKRDSKDVHIQRLWKDTERRRLSISQAEMLQEEPNLPVLILDL